MPSQIQSLAQKWEAYKTAAFGYALLLLLLFGDVLFGPSSVVLSQPGTDVYGQFLGWRQFGFNALKSGDLPLWNPHVYSGAPFIAGFQSALFYPLNWIHLLLPVERAINLGICLHLFLLAYGTFVWVKGWKFSAPAAFLSGTMLMLGGPSFFHVYAGHLPNLGSMAWAPFFLWSLDRTFEKQYNRAIVFGALAFCMQLLAGHVQYVYYTLLVGGLYLLLRLAAAPSERRVPTTLNALLLLTLGIGLSAVQLMPAFNSASESLRGGKLPYDFASSYSLPWQNLVTLLVPGFFGDLRPGTPPYWGSWRMWEMTLFQGATAVALACYGLFVSNTHLRRIVLPLVIILVLLAVGANFPLYPALYGALPGYGSFRGTSKFAFFLALCLALLAAAGLDAVISRLRTGETAPPPKPFIGVWSVCTLGMLGVAIFLYTGDIFSPTGTWGSFLRSIGRAPGGTEVSRYLAQPGFASAAALFAAGQCIVAGLIALLAGACLCFASRLRAAPYLLLGLAMAELFVFARHHRPTFDTAITRDPAVLQVRDSKPGAFRILNIANPNMGLTLGYGDLWGEDPLLLRRYAEWMAYSQGVSPDKATQDIKFQTPSPAWGMLRTRYTITPTPQGNLATQLEGDLPQIVLVRNWKRLSSRDEILAHVFAPNFEPTKEVVLESVPNPAPASTPLQSGEAAKVVSQTSDTLHIQADLKAPAVLLVTDAYSKNWRARPLLGNTQTSYQVLPANYILRAIPLGAGKHDFVLEYSPASLQLGAVISAITLCLLGMVDWRLRRVPAIQAEDR